MILLITPYQNAPDCAAQIERATRDKVKTVNTLRLALSALREREFSVVVADENFLESTPGSTDSLQQRMHAATPVVIDLLCNRPEKIAKLVSATANRRQLEFDMARCRAVEELRSELKSDVTGLLLSSEMLLKCDVSERVAERLNTVIEIVQRMKTRLASNSPQ
jgi:hypothetical protein